MVSSAALGAALSRKPAEYPVKYYFDSMVSTQPAMEQDDYEIWLEVEREVQRELWLEEDLVNLASEKLAEEHLKQRRLDEYKDSYELLQHVCVTMGAVMEEITK